MFKVGQMRYVVVVDKLGVGQNEGRRDDANRCQEVYLICHRPGASEILEF